MVQNNFLAGPMILGFVNCKDHDEFIDEKEYDPTVEFLLTLL